MLWKVLLLLLLLLKFRFLMSFINFFKFDFFFEDFMDFLIRFLYKMLEMCLNFLEIVVKKFDVLLFCGLWFSFWCFELLRFWFKSNVVEELLLWDELLRCLEDGYWFLVYWVILEFLLLLVILVLMKLWSVKFGSVSFWLFVVCVLDFNFFLLVWYNSFIVF